MSDLTLIIPAKNEKESLPKVLDELREFDFKINFIEGISNTYQFILNTESVDLEFDLF